MKKKKKKKKVIKNDDENEIKDLLFKFTSALPEEKLESPESAEAGEAAQDLGTTVPTPKNDVVDASFQVQQQEKQPDHSTSPRAPSVSEGGKTSKTGDNS